MGAFLPLRLCFQDSHCYHWANGHQEKQLSGAPASGTDETWPQVFWWHFLPQFVNRNYPLFDVHLDNEIYYHYRIFVSFWLKLKGVSRHNFTCCHFTDGGNDADYQGADFKIYGGKRRKPHSMRFCHPALPIPFPRSSLRTRGRPLPIGAGNNGLRLWFWVFTDNAILSPPAEFFIELNLQRLFLFPMLV